MPTASDIRLITKADLNPILNGEFKALVHKLRHPMTKILAKVPGETLADRARAIGVSRQTMYVWQAEQFRPVGNQAKKIAKLTGVRVEHIREYADDTGRPLAKKAPKLAKRSKKAPRGNGGNKRRKRGVVDAQGGSGTDGTPRGGTGG